MIYRQVGTYAPQNKTVKTGCFFCRDASTSRCMVFTDPPPFSIASKPSFKWKGCIFGNEFCAASGIDLHTFCPVRFRSLFALVFWLWTATIFCIFAIWDDLRLIDFRQASRVFWPRFGQVPFNLATSTSWNSSQLSCNRPWVPETPKSLLRQFLMLCKSTVSEA